jgi:hypothetical protein
MTRPGRFIINTIIAFGLILVLGSLFLLIQGLFHLFDPQVAVINSILSKANNEFSKQVLAGISLGMVILIPSIVLFPLFHKGIDKRVYLSSLLRGIIASGIFLSSQALFQFLGKISRTYQLIVIVLVVIATFILIELAVSLSRRGSEVSFRTEITAAIASGLLFSLIMKLIGFISALLF